MIYVIVIFTVLMGLVLGSFVNALQYRIENKMTIGGRSICPSCKHQLAVLDLVPVFSWLLLGGKCRYCHKDISPQYPVVEILSGFSLLVLAHSFLPSIVPARTTIQSLVLSGSLVNYIQLGFWFILISALSSCLILLALHDYKTGYVLSYYAYAAIAVALILVSLAPLGFVGWPLVANHLYSSLGAALPFALIWLLSRGKWMGAGDIEIAALVGIVLGFPAVIVGMYFAFILGSIVGIALIIARKSRPGSQISFAPFLIAGIYFGLLFAQQIIGLYDKMFLG